MTRSFALDIVHEKGKLPELFLSGTLDRTTCSSVWNQAVRSLSEFGASNSKTNAPLRVVNLAGIIQMDTAGAALIYSLGQKFFPNGAISMEIRDIPPQYAHLMETAFSAFDKTKPFSSDFAESLSFTEKMGKKGTEIYSDFHDFLSGFGEIIWVFFHSICHPARLRWNHIILVAEAACVNALPIVTLISFIVGLVMAFQSAIPMKMFGVEIYVANLIGIAMVRELGPLMTAIVLAGRSASAFAAEIGTMKINEEIDALGTMGLDPVAFLIVPRILASVVLTPLLALFANFIGILGGSVVLVSMGYPIIVYYHQVVDFVSWVDFAGGLLKCLVFGMIIAATGCIRGYQTGQGASAVGSATTSAVVTSIVLIVLTDGLFSIVYYNLGI